MSGNAASAGPSAASAGGPTVVSRASATPGPSAAGPASVAAGPASAAVGVAAAAAAAADVASAAAPSATSAPTMRDRVHAYVALTKPRIIELLLVTTLPAMVLAWSTVQGMDPAQFAWLAFWTLVGGVNQPIFAGGHHIPGAGSDSHSPPTCSERGQVCGY